MEESETRRILPNSTSQRDFPLVRDEVRIGGFVIAGPCIVLLVFFGFSLMLIGTLVVATSFHFYSLDGKESHDNPYNTAGIWFLSVGGGISLFGLILCCIAKTKLDRIASHYRTLANESEVAVFPPNTTTSGASYQADYSYTSEHSGFSFTQPTRTYSSHPTT